MDSDEALFERLIGGELAAFDRLWARYERPLFAFVRARLGDAAEAEDVLHEAFMAVLRERERRSEVRSFRAWLYQVAHHLCLNRLRTRRRAGRAHDEIAELAPSHAPGAQSELETRERTERLARAVAKLPPAHAELYRLRAAGMPYEEIATILGVPIGTVKSRLHELVGSLREEMSR